MNEPLPHRGLFKVLQSFCPAHLYEEIEGDLLQKYEKDVAAIGRKRAGRKLLWNAMRFFRPGIIMRNKNSFTISNAGMTSHVVKMFWRSAWRNKTYSTINITGLVLGMTAFSLVSLFVWQETNYDNFHEKRGRIFRVRHDRYTNGELTRQWAAGPMGIGSDLKNNFAEVVRYVKLNKGVDGGYVLSKDDILFKEDKLLYATEGFFKLFSFPLVKGVDSVVLRDPFTMVLSESLARRYFGDVDPVGKTLLCNGKDEYRVTGVFKDLPATTHLKFEALFSFESLLKILGPEETESLMTNWGWEGTYTYIETVTSQDADVLQSKLPQFVEKTMGETLRGWNEWMAFTLQPVESIHLKSDTPDEIADGGDERSIQILSMVAIFILGMAWINYVNLAIARSATRSKEVGIKKILGSSQFQLITQFLFESFAFKIAAVFITVLLILLLAPRLGFLTGREIDWTVFDGYPFWSLIFLVFGIGILVSGLYPAMVISTFRPATILKGRVLNSSRGNRLRKILVGLQFIASMILVAGMGVIQQQVRFLQASATGIEMGQVLVVKGPTAKDSSYFKRADTFRKELLRYSPVKGISISTDVPGHHIRNSNGGARLVGQDMKMGNTYKAIMTDEDFIETYGLVLIAGRNFSGRAVDQWKQVIVNETAMKQLGYSDPEKLIGRKMYLWDSEPEIIGVARDYHHESLKKKINPVVLVFDKEISEFYSLKISGNNFADIIARTESLYKEMFPGNPFTFFFLDDYYNRQYQSDKQFGKVFGLFTATAIVIACLGLFGLCSYMVVQRAREIGIRKVLGATGSNLLKLLYTEFFWLLLIAGFAGIPIAWWLTDDWLSGYANRVELHLLNFVIPASVIALVAFSTVGALVFKAIRTNPTESLKYE